MFNMFSWHSVGILLKISLCLLFAICYGYGLFVIITMKPDTRVETCPAPDQVLLIDNFNFKKENPKWIKCPVAGQHLTLNKELYSTFADCKCDDK